MCLSFIVFKYNKINCITVFIINGINTDIIGFQARLFGVPVMLNAVTHAENFRFLPFGLLNSVGLDYNVSYILDIMLDG